MVQASRLSVWLAAAVLLMSAGPHAQSPSSVVGSYARARTALDAAIAAHGGAEALAAARRIRVTLDGHDIWRNQSRSVDPPYDRERLTIELTIDLSRSRVIVDRISSFPGGLHNHALSVTDGSRGFNLNRRRLTHTAQPPPPADTQVANLYHLPQLVLAKARENAAGLRWLGRMRSAAGADVDVIATTTPQGPLTMLIEPATSRLRGYTNVVADPLVGDTEQEFEFLDYRQIGGVLMPSTRRVHRAGELLQELTYSSVTTTFEIAETSLVPPSDSVDLTSLPAIEPVRTLAPGVWAVGGGQASLVVALSDHVVVVDAPGNSADTMARIEKLAPGKPIRYVVPTHHHDDHSGGIARYAAAGATIVTTPANRRYFERMAAARTTLGADVPPVAADRVRIETVSGKKRVFTDGSRTLEVHDIGPSPHANEMLVAWIPDEGILHQADLISAPPNGAVTRGANNDTTMHLATWVQGRGLTVKMFSGAHSSLANPAAFGEILKQPLLPAR